MKLAIASFLMLSLLFAACSVPIESEMVAEVVLSEEVIELQKVSFLSDDELYLYSFDYDKSVIKYREEIFTLGDGSEIIVYNSNEAAVGIEEKVGSYIVLKSEEKVAACYLDYRVVLQDSENLILRSKACEGQDSDLASKALDSLLEGLTIDEL